MNVRKEVSYEAPKHKPKGDADSHDLNTPKRGVETNFLVAVSEHFND